MEEILAKILTAEKSATDRVQQAKLSADTKKSAIAHDLEQAYEKKILLAESAMNERIALFSDMDVSDHIKEVSSSIDIKKTSKRVLEIIYGS